MCGGATAVLLLDATTSGNSLATPHAHDWLQPDGSQSSRSQTDEQVHAEPATINDELCSSSLLRRRRPRLARSHRARSQSAATTTTTATTWGMHFSWRANNRRAIMIIISILLVAQRTGSLARSNDELAVCRRPGGSSGGSTISRTSRCARLARLIHLVELATSCCSPAARVQIMSRKHQKLDMSRAASFN